MPLLYFSVECRAWTIGLENYLKDEPNALPPINHNEYHFGAWLNALEQAQYVTQPSSIQVIESLHQQLHLLAAELCELHAQGLKDVALARLGELHSLRDTLLEQMHLLAQETKQ